jgi:hypothetical protein
MCVSFLHVETRKVLRPSEIRLLHCSEADVFQMSKVGGQTLRFNMIHVHEI